MKAITLHQPWASLMAAEIKRIETRSWGTSYRGPLAIHAGKKVVYDDELLSLLNCTWESLPRGAVLCIVDLIEIVPTEIIRGRLTDVERGCGDYYDGRYAWRTKMIKVFEKPIPCDGHQGLWNWEPPPGLNFELSTVNSQLPLCGQGSV